MHDDELIEHVKRAVFRPRQQPLLRTARVIEAQRAIHVVDALALPQVYVGRLRPCFRNNSITGTPASPSRSIATIWAYVYLDFRIGYSPEGPIEV